MPTDKPKRQPTEAQMLGRMASLCSRSEHCESDIVARLAAAGLPEEARGRIMARLVGEHFIDDARFARAFVREKSEFAGWGRRKIEMALRQKGVAERYWADAFGQLDSSESELRLRRLIAQKSRTVKAPDDYTRRGKLIRFALSRGFDMELILKCLPDVDT